MTTPMEPFENADNLDEDVGLFEAATHSPVIELPVPVLNTIRLALDGGQGTGAAAGEARGASAPRRSGEAGLQ